MITKGKINDNINSNYNAVRLVCEGLKHTNPNTQAIGLFKFSGVLHFFFTGLFYRR